jgi:GT2 family glycosyltransferase
MIVVDNGSAYQNYLMMKEALSKQGFRAYSAQEHHNTELILDYEPRVLLRSSMNLGYARGNNLGIDIARQWGAEFTLIVNSDVFVEEPGVLESLVRALENGGEKVVAAMPLVLNSHKTGIDANHQVQIRRVPSFLTILVSQSKFLKLLFPKVFREYTFAEATPFECEVRAHVLSGAFTMYKTSFLERCGGFDPNTFLYCEEVIMGFRMREMDVTGILVPTHRVLHLHGTSSTYAHAFKKKFSLSAHFSQTKSYLYYMTKYLKTSRLNRVLFLFVRLVESMLLSTVFFIVALIPLGGSRRFHRDS